MNRGIAQLIGEVPRVLCAVGNKMELALAVGSFDAEQSDRDSRLPCSVHRQQNP